MTWIDVMQFQLGKQAILLFRDLHSRLGTPGLLGQART